jgi:hypothetical protein
MALIKHEVEKMWIFVNMKCKEFGFPRYTKDVTSLKHEV